MSRSGYSDGGDEWATIRWRGAVKSALRGQRGQSFLRELLAALDALPEKKLARSLFVKDGAVCALGSVAVKRGMDMSKFEHYDEDVGAEGVGEAFGIADAMAREIMWVNDDRDLYFLTPDPERRFRDVRAWVVKQLEKPGTDE